MLRVTFQRIKPGKEAQLRAWMDELNSRADEVRATFIDETVRHEQTFILHTVDGPVLVGATEVEDFRKGREAFKRSQHAIDQEHKKVLRECLGDRLQVPPLYDVALDPTGGDDA